MRQAQATCATAASSFFLTFVPSRVAALLPLQLPILHQLQRLAGRMSWFSVPSAERPCGILAEYAEHLFDYLLLAALVHVIAHAV